ncbi:MAG: ATP-binding protein [Oscillospiraceae bacterium]|nr:ATP-binding protein [Oscillospiraceae bacterium]
MRKHLFLYTTLIICAGLLGFFFISVYITRDNNVNVARNTVIERTRIFANFFNYADLNTFVEAGGNTRITVIGSDGSVLADSHPFDTGAQENRLNRPEIQAAANNAPDVYIRYSDTFGADMVYYALRVDGEDDYVFVRTSIPVAQIDSYLYQVLPLLIILLLAIILVCLFLVRGVANRIIKPFNSVEENLRQLSDGEYSPRPLAGSYEEIDKITKGINDIAFVLQNSFNALRDEKDKLSYVLNNIGDGLFIIDENANIALVNGIALDIFDVTTHIINRKVTYLTNDTVLKNSVEDCIAQAKSSLFELVLNGKIYLVTIKRLMDTGLTMVVLSDVTESRESAKRKEEFFSNASHELKTPLTAIKGFNELSVINNKDDSINKYIEGISRESNRMMSLIDDMLKLSELENAETVNPVPVALAKTVSEVCEAMAFAITDKHIIFESKGDAIVAAEPRHIYELVKNLVENAVRYNDNGGKITVSIENNKNTMYLTVSDNGIGISPAEQTRIFERFYRVEKSRSVKNGGTGLGLSIVKHICSLYGWNLSLKSRLGVGTEVKINFNHT